MGDIMSTDFHENWVLKTFENAKSPLVNWKVYSLFYIFFLTGNKFGASREKRKNK